MRGRGEWLKAALLVSGLMCDIAANAAATALAFKAQAERLAAQAEALEEAEGDAEQIQELRAQAADASANYERDWEIHKAQSAGGSHGGASARSGVCVCTARVVRGVHAKVSPLGTAQGADR